MYIIDSLLESYDKSTNTEKAEISFTNGDCFELINEYLVSGSQRAFAKRKNNNDWQSFEIPLKRYEKVLGIVKNSPNDNQVYRVLTETCMPRRHVESIKNFFINETDTEVFEVIFEEHHIYHNIFLRYTCLLYQ